MRWPEWSVRFHFEQARTAKRLLNVRISGGLLPEQVFYESELPGKQTRLRSKESTMVRRPRARSGANVSRARSTQATCAAKSVDEKSR
ncbi:MAG TPA: hypothetical protein VF943_11605 [Burkholderiales bacterium]